MGDFGKIVKSFRVLEMLRDACLGKALLFPDWWFGNLPEELLHKKT